MLALIYWFISIMWSLWWLRQAFYTGLSDPKLFAALILGSMWLMICTSRQMRERRSTKRTNIIRGYLYYCVLVLMQTATLLISSKYHFGVISVVIL
jgi:hypothetical protein